MAIDLRQLRYFIVVAEEGHITRAAERLGMGQPPLSLQIKALEAQLGLQLFRRKPRGVELTESGHILLKEARAAFTQLDHAERATKSVGRGEQGRLRLGIAPTAPFHPFVPQVIRAFRDAYPGVSMTLDECLSKQAVADVREARLDAALIRAELSDCQGLMVHRLLNEPMVIALPAAHPLAISTDQPRGLRDFAADEFIVFAREEGPGIFDVTIAACQRAGFMPRIGQEAPRITSTLGLVAVGLGVAIVPNSMSRLRMDGVVFCELIASERPHVPIQLVYPSNSSSAVLGNFVTHVRKAASAETTWQPAH